MNDGTNEMAEAFPSVSSSSFNNPHFSQSAAAGPSQHRPFTAMNGSIEASGEEWRTDRHQSSAPFLRQHTGPSFSTTHHSGSPFFQSSPKPAQLANSSPSSDEIQITGSRFTQPSAPVLAYPSPSFLQYAGKGTSSSTPSAMNPPQSPFFYPNFSPGQGRTSTGLSSGPIIPPPCPIGTNGFCPIGSNKGISASSAIDLSDARLPSPPPVNDKRPVCIGSILTRAIMLYPCSAAVVGVQAPEGSHDRYQTVNYRGAEFLKVRIKVSQCDLKIQSY